MISIFKWLLLVNISILANSKDIIIHAIPHTHLDAGWIETFETYYQSSVLKIIESLLPALE